MLVKLLMAGVFVAALGFAQGDMGGGGGGGGGMGGGGGGGGMLVARPSKMDSFCDMLTLDKEQRKQSKSMLDAAAKEAAPLRDQMTKSKAELSAAVAAGKGQDELGKLVESYSMEKAQMAQIEIKAFAGVFKSLSPEQKQRPCPNRRGPTVACSAQVFEMFSGIFMKKNWDSN
jgi:hypothetical protein